MNLSAALYTIGGLFLWALVLDDLIPVGIWNRECRIDLKDTVELLDEFENRHE